MDQNVLFASNQNIYLHVVWLDAAHKKGVAPETEGRGGVSDARPTL